MIIAIDGPAGSGKSTIAKNISKLLNYEYLDTGALYRGVTYLLNEKNVSLDSKEEASNIIKNSNFTFKNNKLYLNNVLIEDEIRKNIISKKVSEVASSQYIRNILTKVVRNIAKVSKNIIMDGRDIGTVVFPNAEVKVFLTASSEVRAQRRYEELLKNGENHTFEEIKSDIIKRDKLDSNRKVSPLKKSKDAIEINTDNYSIEDVINIILNIINKQFN